MFARGDGLAMAYRAGARVINSEYVQFHPTAFYKKDAPAFLITEALRGAGAVLINTKGERFMERYDAQRMELAPRDVVARSIYIEMQETGTDHVYLDISSRMSNAQITKEFPFVTKTCDSYGIDITKEAIPVVPAAHYFCGGVWVDTNGKSSVDNLFAIGEVSCTGIHGANRLASTSLLEGLVWGYRAAQVIEHERGHYQRYEQSMIPPWKETGTEEPDPALISQDLAVIRHTMWNYVGLIRSTHRLQRAIRELRNLEIEIERFYRAVKPNDALIGLRNSVRCANIITNSAWENKSSVGCHYRAGL
jgi:L-aspartate oxidase